MKTTLVFLSIVIATALLYYYFPERRLPPDSRIDRLVVLKSKAIMNAYQNGVLLKTYTVSIGKNAIGDKEEQGDKRTPEGSYTITSHNPHSSYYKNLGISYPNNEDRRNAQLRGIDPGGDVKIHGLREGYLGKFHRWLNWTAGCIAVTNEEMDELYNAVADGTPIVIKP